MFRSVSYWTAALSVAVLAAQAVGNPKAVGDAAEWMAPSEGLIHVMPVPEPARAAFLGIGIVAVAFTYRRAWLNMKRRGEERKA